MTHEEACLLVLAACIIGLLIISVAIMGRLNALDDDNPPTIIIPPLVKDELDG